MMVSDMVYDSNLYVEASELFAKVVATEQQGEQRFPTVSLMIW